MSGNISTGQYDSINHMLAERRMAARSAGTDAVHVLEIARQRRAEAVKAWLASSALGCRRGRAILTALAPLLCSVGLVASFAVLLVAGGALGRGSERSPTVPGMHWSHYASSSVLVMIFGSGAVLDAGDALSFREREPAREHGQWVTMMRLDDNRTARLAGRPSAELELAGGL